MRDKIWWLFFGALALLLPLAAPAAEEEKEMAEPAAASGHGVRAKHFDPGDFTPEERERIDRLFFRVICKCPRENWSKTLAGCPDACADPQKNEIRAGVKAGQTDAQILAEQVQKYGPRVLAIPKSLLASLVPYIVLLILAVFVLVLLGRSIRPAAKSSGDAARRAGSAEADLSAEDRKIADAVERDLEELDR